MRQLTTEEINTLKTQGYIHISGFFVDTEIEAINAACELTKEKNYNKENLARRAVYPSQESEGRYSHAHMISSSETVLPTVLTVSEIMNEVTNFHNSVLESFLGVKTPNNSRIMWNFQTYLKKSLPVAEHFDGEYLSYVKESDTSFSLKEGLLPSLVIVGTLYNENKGEVQGTYLRDVVTKAVINSISQKGDLFIFDNIRFTHGVETLENQRRMFGARTFDAGAYHFVSNDNTSAKISGLEYKAVHDGEAAFMTPEQSVTRQLEFLNNEYAEMAKRVEQEKAVF
jgi:hypothetical protein